MTSSDDAVRDRILGLAWGLWAEAGLSGWADRRRDVAIDIEALIHFTAAVGEHDPRLRDESTDWCVQFGGLVSKVRLKTIAKVGIGTAERFGEYAATVNAHSGLTWPTGPATARVVVPSRRSSLDLTRASLIQLRARAIFGVAARAEILSTMAIDPAATYTGSQLAERTRFGRRMTVEAADLLVRSGLLASPGDSPARTFGLGRGSEIRALLAPVPSRSRAWPSAFRVLWVIWLISEERRPRTVAVRAVEARKLLAGLDRHAALAGLPLPPQLDASVAAWTDYERWVSATVERVGS
ncbi:MAG TPA: hypothetical protein VIM50_03095 [Candidatus Limnocylindria bacterium]|jgi:hypothetical protein